MHNHRLRLIVSVVSYGDGPCTDLTSHPGQKSIPGTSGSLFERKFLCSSQRRHICRLYRDRQAPLSSQRGDESGIGTGVFAPHLVIEMSDVQIQS
jgi:hypothetical protein